MIIHRLANAIRHQNWSQIITEILIVVIGIFLGLQVTAWNDERQERVEEIIYIERLLEDADNSLVAQEELLVIEFERKKQREEFYKLVAGNAITADNLKVASEHYRSGYSGWANLDYYEDTIEELISTGNLSIIRSSEFKNKMARFRSGLAKGQRVMKLSSEFIFSNSVALRRLIRRNANTGMIISSPADLNNNPEVYDLLSANDLRYNGMYQNNLRTYEQSKEFRDVIAAELDRFR